MFGLFNQPTIRIQPQYECWTTQILTFGSAFFVMFFFLSSSFIYGNYKWLNKLLLRSFLKYVNDFKRSQLDRWTTHHQALFITFVSRWRYILLLFSYASLNPKHHILFYIYNRSVLLLVLPCGRHILKMERYREGWPHSFLWNEPRLFIGAKSIIS